jgi:hypothetical protein
MLIGYAFVALEVNVSVGVSGIQPRVKVDTGNDTLLEERERATIFVRLRTDPRRVTYALELLVCATPSKKSVKKCAVT